MTCSKVCVEVVSGQVRDELGNYIFNSGRVVNGVEICMVCLIAGETVCKNCVA